MMSGSKRTVSLKTKFTLFLLLLTTVPVAIVAGIMRTLYTQVVKTELEEQQKVIASANAVQLNGFLDGKVKTMESMVNTYRTDVLAGSRAKKVELLQTMKGDESRR
ncbi:hypothetical protein ACHHV8_28735 [Paenibacillus sp. TAB 01]|uniref:hypothetical protein n=1 Tax=Paenibacillus sp. TAB 01 TaxID=3368988 RepID=UPI003751CF7A